MGVHVRLENERREILADLNSSQEFTLPLIECVDLSLTKCLAFIDAYGAAVFNRMQMEVLIEEVKAAKDGVSDARLRDQHKKWLRQMTSVGVGESAARYPIPSATSVRRHTDAIIELAQEGMRRPHRYLWFVGD
jgi:hypothetical protein